MIGEGAIWAEAGTVVPCDHSPVLGASGLVTGFAVRQPGVEVGDERKVVLERLRASHEAVLAERGLLVSGLRLAEQVHGLGVAVVDARHPVVAEGVDALVTADAGVTLGIYVADCCAVYLVDWERRVIGLVHSGAKGTRLGVVPATLERMRAEFGCRAEGMVAVLSPCIRPPHYEVDFAAEIRGQCESAGVGRVFDSGVCTGSGLERYYSYRREMGKTGRMLAFLSLGF